MKNVTELSKKCLVCGDIFYRINKRKPLSHWLKRKYCSRVCSNKKGAWNKGTIGLIKPNSGSFKKGIVPWTKGKKLPQFSGVNNPSWKLKISKTCDYCQEEIILPPWRIRTKKFFCNRVCWALGTRGKGSPVFKGEEAVANIRSRIDQLPEYRSWHATILRRDNYLCIQCGARKNLEVDHIKRFLHIVQENKIKTPDDARNCKELWDINNGRTLCKEYHRKTDTYGTKGTKKAQLK